jgi:chitin disaccharide deacetylase
MKRLIVNADDLGRTPGVNQGVADAHRHGLVTSATLMVNHRAAGEARQIARDCPRLGLGLHFALTGGVPTLPPERVPSLVDAAGRLPAKPDGLAQASFEDIVAEGRAQLGRFEELLGRPPSHLDSHHHAHRLPLVLEAVIRLAREAGLPVRIASPEMRDTLLGAGIRTSDAFVESFYAEGATLQGLLDALDALPEGTSELMCHPALVDEELRSGSSYAVDRERELVALTHEDARRRVEELGIRLISFAEL